MLDTTDEFPSMKCYLADAEDLHKRLRRVIEEREVAYGDDPMGKTGLCDRKFKIQGSREYPVIVEQYTTDFGLLRAIAFVCHALSPADIPNDKTGNIAGVLFRH